MLNFFFDHLYVIKTSRGGAVGGGLGLIRICTTLADCGSVSSSTSQSSREQKTTSSSLETLPHSAPHR